MKTKLSLYSFAIISLLLIQSCGEKTKKETDSLNTANNTVEVEKVEAEKVETAQEEEDMSPEQLKDELIKFVGSKKSWMIPRLSKLKPGMTLDEARAIFPELEDSNEYGYSTHYPKDDDPLVKKYRFIFNKSKLSSVECQFHHYFEKEMFYNASIEAYEKKWGKLDEKNKKTDFLIWLDSDYKGVQAGYMVDHWQLTMDIVR